MDAWGWFWTVTGLALLALTLVDFFLTVLHADVDGPVAHHVQKALGRGLVSLARRGGNRIRRGLLALTGPVALVATFILWPALTILSFALIQWPHIRDGYSHTPEMGALGFVDALYYTGVTVTVLGYGDITPLTTPLKVLSFVASGAGFILLTGIVTYLVNILGNVGYRNAAALRVQDESGNSGDGVDLIISSIPDENVGDLRERFLVWTDILRSLQAKYAMYPIAAFYYRPRNSLQDPEPMLRTLVEATIAGLLVSREDGMRRLRPVVHQMDAAATRYLAVIVRQHMHGDVRRAVEEAHARPEDHALVRDVQRRLHDHLGGSYTGALHGDRERAVRLACRARIVLDALDRMTAWRSDDPRGESHLKA